MVLKLKHYKLYKKEEMKEWDIFTKSAQKIGQRLDEAASGAAGGDPQ